MASVTPTVYNDTASVYVRTDVAISSDTFDRVTANGWGVSTTGQAWTVVTGAAASYSTNGTQGRITTAATSNYLISLALPTNVHDVEVLVEGVRFSAVSATGRTATLSVLAGYQDSSNYYQLMTHFGDLNSTLSTYVDINGEIRVRSGGISYIPLRPNIIYNNPSINPLIAGSSYSIRAKKVGPWLYVKAWNGAIPEPTNWLVTAWDTILANAGIIAIYLNTYATTPVGMVVSIGSITVNFSTSVALFRQEPDGTRVAVRNSPFQSNGDAVSTWDHEAPLMVGVSYVAMASTEGATDEYVSDTVALASGNDGWIKDPIQPNLSLRLDNCSEHTPQCMGAEQAVFFQRLESVSNTAANGILQVINSPYPINIAQVRKSDSGVLRVISRTHEDIVKLQQLLSSGRTLLLQLPTKYGWALSGWGSAYIAVDTVTSSRIAQTDMSKPYRAWDVPFQVTQRPADETTGQSLGSDIGPRGHTYADLAATGITYADLAALGFNYLQITKEIPS